MYKWIVLLMVPLANADGFYVYGGVNAFDDVKAQPEYNVQSPIGVFGGYYQHNITNKLDIKVGVEHMSSIPTKETGSSLNMFTAKLTLKLF